MFRYPTAASAISRVKLLYFLLPSAAVRAAIYLYVEHVYHCQHYFVVFAAVRTAACFNTPQLPGRYCRNDAVHTAPSISGIKVALQQVSHWKNNKDVFSLATASTLSLHTRGNGEPASPAVQAVYTLYTQQQYDTVSQ